MYTVMTILPSVLVSLARNSIHISARQSLESTMKRTTTLAIGSLLMLGAAGFAGAAAAPVSSSCDRECLRGMITAYLHALVKHDVGKLPFADNVRITEDSVEKARKCERAGQPASPAANTPANSAPPCRGMDLVRSVTKLQGYRQDFLDERAGIAGSDVMVEESGAPILLVIRMKIQNQRITELETVATRSRADGAIFALDGLDGTTEVMNYAPRKDQLNTREEMIRMALLYPAGLEAGSFVKVDAPFTPEAYRLENG